MEGNVTKAEEREDGLTDLTETDTNTFMQRSRKQGRSSLDSQQTIVAETEKKNSDQEMLVSIIRSSDNICTTKSMSENGR